MSIALGLGNFAGLPNMPQPKSPDMTMQYLNSLMTQHATSLDINDSGCGGMTVMVWGTKGVEGAATDLAELPDLLLD